MKKETIFEIIRYARKAATISSVVTAAGFTGQQLAHRLREPVTTESSQQVASFLNQSSDSSSNNSNLSNAQANRLANQNASRQTALSSTNSAPFTRKIAGGSAGDSGAAQPTEAANPAGATDSAAAAAANQAIAGMGQQPEAGSNQMLAGKVAGGVEASSTPAPSGAVGASGAATSADNLGTSPKPNASPTATPTTAAGTTPTSVTQTGRKIVENFSAAASAYSGAVLSVQPSFMVELAATLKADQTYTDTVKLSAYTDSACTTAAGGTLSAAANPVSLALGVATFSSTSYTLASHAEQSIYLKGAASILAQSACASSATYIFQHFNTGSGYLTLASGAAGMAGAPFASRNDVSVAIVQDSSGNYLVGGSSSNISGGTELFVARYFPDGTLDTSFASSGVFLFQNNAVGPAGVAASSRSDQVGGLRLDSSGNIVAFGTTADSAGGTDIFLLRLTSSGSIDSSLSPNGLIVFNQAAVGCAGGSGAGKSDLIGLRKPFVIDSDGSYLVAISSRNSSGGLEAGLMRVSSSGALSKTFGAGGGVATFINHSGAGPGGAAVASRNEFAEAVLVDGSERAVVLYSVNTGSGGSDALVARFKGITGSDGTLDTSFNSTGYLDVHSTLGNSAPADLNIDSSGRIVAVEQTGTALSVFRALSTGSIDTSFSATGIVSFNSSGPSAAGSTSAADAPAGLTIDSSGNYLIAGTSSNSSSGKEVALWRFTSVGVLDTTFGGASTGYVAYQRSGGRDLAGQTGSSAIDLVSGGVLFDSVGRIVLPVSSRNATGTNSDFAIIRFQSNGSLDN